jgi:hypothetical protein
MPNAERAGAAKAVFANGETRLLIPVPVQGLKEWNARIVRKAAA